MAGWRRRAPRNVNTGVDREETPIGEVSDADLVAIVTRSQTRMRGGLVDAQVKQRADAAMIEIERRARPFLAAIAEDPCDPARYYGEPTERLEFFIYMLDMIEDWHDVYQAAIREERWFVRHFLNAARRRCLRESETGEGDA